MMLFGGVAVYMMCVIYAAIKRDISGLVILLLPMLAIFGGVMLTA